MFEQPNRHHRFCGGKSTTLRISKDDKAKQTEEEWHKNVPRSPAVNSTGVCQGIQDCDRRGHQHRIAQKVDPPHLFSKCYVICIIDLQEDEQDGKGDAANGKVEVEDPTPCCVGDDGTADKGAKSCADSVDAQDDANIVAAKA